VKHGLFVRLTVIIEKKLPDARQMTKTIIMAKGN
jgi:hypothetical protein